MSEVDPLDLVPLLLQPVDDAGAQAPLVDHHQRRLVRLDSVDDVAHHRHGVVALVALDRHDVASLPDGDDRTVGPKPCRVHADDDGRRRVFVLRSPHGVVDSGRPDELVVGRVGELTVHLDVGLGAVGAVLVNDLLIDLLVRMLDRARVHDLGVPKVALGVKAFVEVAAVAPRVAERQPEAVRRVLREEARRDRPDAVVDTAGFVEHQHDPGEVVNARVGVGVLR